METNIAKKVKKIKEENRVFLPNFSLLFEDFLDIFSVFKTKERVSDFWIFLFRKGIKFNEKFANKNAPVVFIHPHNRNVFGVDYGFFLDSLYKWICLKNSFADDSEECGKVKRLVYLFYGIDVNFVKVNYPAQVLMKELFGRIYNITNYKNKELKGSIFFQNFVENEELKAYVINTFYVSKFSIQNLFFDKNLKDYFIDFLRKIETFKVDLISKKVVENPVDLFTYLKF